MKIKTVTIVSNSQKSSSKNSMDLMITLPVLANTSGFRKFLKGETNQQEIRIVGAVELK